MNPDVAVIYTHSGSALPGRPAPEWLSRAERRVLAGLRFPKRRRDWLLGRNLAKAALAHVTKETDLTQIEVIAAPDGSPHVFQAGELSQWQLSISHSHGTGLVALGLGDVALGCDLEAVSPRSPQLVEDFFNEDERAWLAAVPEGQRPLFDNLVWSAKESVLKALRTGLRRDTRTISIERPDLTSSSAGPAAGNWHALRTSVASENLRFKGWWTTTGTHVMTLVAHPRPGPPHPLFVETPLP